jgi:hypothetical protein
MSSEDPSRPRAPTVTPPADQESDGREVDAVDDVDEPRVWEPGEWSSRARHPAARGLDVRPAAGPEMPAFVALLAGCRPRRGGNRLPVGHPARGRAPRYERCRELPPDPERRDKMQRHRTRIAAAEALKRAELDGLLHWALGVMLDLTDERCSITYHSLATIGKAAGGQDERTVGSWLARLHELGWVQRRHRFKIEGGQVRGTSNEWRIDIPDHLRAERHAVAAAAAARTRKANKGKGSRYTPPARARQTDGPAQPPAYQANEAERPRPNERAESQRRAREARRNIQALKARAMRAKHVPP